MAQPHTKSWTIPSTNAEAAQVQQGIVDAIQEREYNREALFAIRLALDEALVNAVKHGNQGDADKNVKIDFAIDDERVVIEIEDEGVGFDPADVPDPTDPENVGNPNGRGVMLMRAYMTEVRFNDNGNRVTLIKRRDCERPHSG